MRPFTEKFFGHDPNPEQQRKRGAQRDKKVLMKADQENLNHAPADVRFVESEFQEEPEPQNRERNQQRKEKENREAGTRTFPGKIVWRELFGFPGIIGRRQG